MHDNRTPLIACFLSDGGMLPENSSIRSTVCNTGLPSSLTRPVSSVLTHFLDVSASQLSHRILSPLANSLRSRISFTLLIFLHRSTVTMFQCLVLRLTLGTCSVTHVAHLSLPPPPNTLFTSESAVIRHCSPLPLHRPLDYIPPLSFFY